MHPIKGSTPLDGSIAYFLSHQRFFGRGYWYQEYILKVLGRFASRRGAADLSAALFDPRGAKISGDTSRPPLCMGDS